MSESDYIQSLKIFECGTRNALIFVSLLVHGKLSARFVSYRVAGTARTWVGRGRGSSDANRSWGRCCHGSHEYWESASRGVGVPGIRFSTAFFPGGERASLTQLPWEARERR